MSGTRKIEAGLQCQNSGNRPGVKPPWANNAALALVTARVRLLISRETKMDGSVEQQTMKKVAVRLVPFLCLLYTIAFIDRINVAFAALTMGPDLGLSSAAFGLGAGLFFIGYFLFEVPSNLLLERFGARRWIARVMFSWGILSVGFAFVQGATSFYVLRFLLGIAEAGFFPGIILYLTYWFPKRYRGRVTAGFMVAIPVASFIAAPLSGV